MQVSYIGITSAFSRSLLLENIGVIPHDESCPASGCRIVVIPQLSPAHSPLNNTCGISHDELLLVSGYRIPVLPQLSKLMKGVRLPLPAHELQQRDLQPDGLVPRLIAAGQADERGFTAFGGTPPHGGGDSPYPLQPNLFKTTNRFADFERYDRVPPCLKD